MEAYLKISKIEGDCTDDKHKNWIRLLSFSHGVSQPVRNVVDAAGARTAGRCEHQDMSVVKLVDKASPLLFLNCCKGDHLPEAKIEVCRATGDKLTFLEYKLTDVVITSVRPGGSAQGNDDYPLEEVALNYNKIEVIYTPIDDKGVKGGPVPASWDRVKNK